MRCVIIKCNMSESVDFVAPPAVLAQSLNDAVEGDKNGNSASLAAGDREGKVGQERGGGEVKEYYCGCGPWHPPQLQVFRDARVFTFLLCLFATIEGALVSGFTSVVLSSLERRYGLTSTSTGAIASTFDVAVLVSVVFISYFGGRGHKPRWLGVSLIVMATGSFIFSLPQFIYGRYRVGSAGLLQNEICQSELDFSDCTSSTDSVLVFFVIGNFLIGVGAAPLFTVGTSYLDEIVRPKKVSIHLGVFYMLSIVGPALGYALGGPFLAIYVDPWEDTHLTSGDPGWVGAWWLSFVFCGVVSLIISVPFFFYPRLLPDSQQVREERVREMAKKSEAGERQGVRGEGGREAIHGTVREVLRDFLSEMWKILRNPSWIFMTAAIVASVIVVSGFASFGPKYVETQFGLSASTASLAIGAVAIPTGGAGVVVGGLIIYFLKLTGRRVALLAIIISGLTIFPLLGLLIHCPTPDIAGITAAYPDGTTDLPDTLALNASCISDCNCTSSVFEPVCGADGVVYFSPCRAGCLNTTGGNFDQCSCVADRLSLTSSLNSSLNSPLPVANSSASDGLCDRNCTTKLIVFLLLIGISLFLVFMLQIPNVLITIRCVAEDQRTLALGVQSFFWRLFGSIPGPILFGAIFDSACIFWQRECGRRGNCWVYADMALSVRAVVLAALAIAGYFIFMVLCWLVYPRHHGDLPGGDQEKESKLANGDAETEGGVAVREEGEGEGEGEDMVHSSSVIGQMQCRDSMAELLEEVGSNRDSPDDTKL